MLDISCRLHRATAQMKRLMKYDHGLFPNVLALFYIAVMYTGGFAMMMNDSWIINIVGMVALAHSMVIAAFMIHECVHNTIFSDKRNNARLAEVLNWVTGGSYSHYEDIRHKHFRHHMDKADVVVSDYRVKLAQRPVMLNIMRAMEWAYIPAVEIYMHTLLILSPFITPTRQQRRARVIVMLLLRGGLFASIVWYWPWIVVYYPLAYILFLTVMRFMDAHQHTYELLETLESQRGQEAKRHDRDYEMRNTFSNLISEKYPWMNLLVLNFGYHNAHHLKPVVPWYRLPKFHQVSFPSGSTQVLPISNLLSAYHRYRVPRMLNADPGDSGVAERRGVDFIGVDGVSFLVAF